MQISFTTANYFGRALNFKTSMAEWGIAERHVIESFSLKEFDNICRDITKAGFHYIEHWMGHAFPKFMTPFLADELKAITQKHGLVAISYSCSIGDPIESLRWTKFCFQTAKDLGIDMITSGLSKESAPIVYELCQEYNIRLAVENHPEKDPHQILEVIGDYGDWLGACVDTGWYATQGYPAEKAIYLLKDHLFHVHLKDVDQVGDHHPVALGQGLVDVPKCVAALKEVGYNGTLSIEYEAGDHDPTLDTKNGREWVEQLWESPIESLKR